MNHVHIQKVEIIIDGHGLPPDVVARRVREHLLKLGHAEAVMLPGPTLFTRIRRRIRAWLSRFF